jgi:Peptidase M50B-like
MVMISIFFIVINLGVILFDWFVFSPVLEFLALFYGVCIGWYSVRDIYDDLITRTAEGSDAVACNKALPCCHPRCVGVQFWIVAFSFQIAGLYLALVWLVSNETK